MDELIKGRYDDLEEELEYFYMREVSVDGIPSAIRDPETQNGRVVLQPMFEIKEDLDYTAPMHWRSGFVLDEEAWLTSGVILHKD